MLLTGAVVAFASSLTVTSGHLDATSTSTSLTTSTTSGAVDFLVTAPSTATAGTAISVALQARAGTSNDATYTGLKCVAFSGPGTSPNATAPTYPAQGTCAAGQSSLTFVAGAATASVTLAKAETTAITATSGSRTGTSGSVVVDSKGVTLSFGTCPKTHTKGSTVTYTLGVPNDSFGNPFTRASALPVNLTLTGADASNYKFVSTQNQALTINVTSGPANNTFDIVESGANKNATLNGSTTATGFTSPSSCSLNGTN